MVCIVYGQKRGTMWQASKVKISSIISDSTEKQADNNFSIQQK